MSEHNDVAVFDPLDERCDPLGVRDVMKSDDRITHCWNHIVNGFLITFKAGSDASTTLLTPSAKRVRFFVMQVDPRDSEGFLAERRWSWIKKRELALADKEAK